MPAEHERKRVYVSVNDIRTGIPVTRVGKKSTTALVQQPPKRSSQARRSSKAL
jgi:hypothetical protein